jgi:hypothetical protein
MSDQLAFGVEPAGRGKAGSNRTTGGPVYQGVCKAIRWLVDQGALDDTRKAGLVAQARSLAASIDRESGHDPRRKQASGVSLSALHAQLAELLQLLDPAETSPAGGALGALVDRWAAEDAAAQAAAAEQPVEP